jgi:hypothetical protein
VDIGFDITSIAPDNSYVRKFTNQARAVDLFLQEQIVPLTVNFKALEYNTAEVQQQIQELETSLQESSHITGPLTSWLDDFLLWAANSTTYGSMVDSSTGYFDVSETTFYTALDEFLSEDSYSRYTDDIPDRTLGQADSIVVSRVTLYHVHIKTARQQVKTLTSTWSKCDGAGTSPLPVCYAGTYVFWSSYLYLYPELVQDLWLAILAIGAVTSFFFIRPSAVLTMCTLVGLVDLELLGTVWFWGLQINSVTAIEIVMAVGLVVDYIAYVLRYYLVQDAKLSNMERIRGALTEIGPAVLVGCCTTFIGIIPLAAASSEIFRTFFKMFVGIILYGGATGLILLPVVLSFFPTPSIKGLLPSDNAIQQLMVNPVAIAVVSDKTDADD